MERDREGGREEIGRGEREKEKKKIDKEEDKEEEGERGRDGGTYLSEVVVSVD